MSDIEHLGDLTPDSKNARRHNPRNVGMIVDAFHEVGAARSIVIDEHGKVLAGNATIEAAAQAGIERVQVVDADGETLVAVRRTGLTEEQKTRLALYDNRTAELAGWDPEALASIMADDGEVLEGLFQDWELEGILEGILAFDAQEERNGIKGLQPNPRELPLDVIYTLDMADCTCCLAVQAGLGYGFRSAQYRLCPYCGKLSGRHSVMFIDNEFKDYNHARHLEVVSRHRPKYATVRDIMSRAQCKKAEIEFYSFEQVMAWATELEQYAENVIVIPKTDCIDDIPERFVLGYSVPTSYGGTPIPAERFRGRRVHLLGGSWKAQLEYLALLGDDVVSLDTNYVQRQARSLGMACSPSGEEFQMQDVGYGYLTNVRYAALALSFGAIGAKVNELFAGNSNPA